jgi:hypothetical protein
MNGYVAFEDEYILQPEHRELLEEVLSEFMSMHDVDQGNVGYKSEVPTKARLIELKQILMQAAKKESI